MQRNCLKCVTALLLSVFCFTVSAQTKTTSGGKLKPEQANMDVRHYTIALDVNFEQKTIDGYTTIDIITAKPTRTLLFDLLDSLNVKSVSVNGTSEPFVYKNNLININTTKELPAGKYAVKVVYGGKPHIAVRPPWDDGFTFTRDSTGHDWLAVTAEGTGGKIYYPCKDHPSDEPNEGADLIITVPKGLVVAGPGLLVKQSTSGNKATFHWRTKYTINNYSILFNVGDYKLVKRSYKSIAGNTVPMWFYVLNEHAEKADKLMDIFEVTIHEKEKYFGEYPWAKEKVGLVETPHLGMEHQSMVAYGNKFRYVKVGNQDYDWLLHHEFGHEWWGNKVTAIDWADYWIHEGIDSYSDALFTLEFAGKPAYIDYFKKSGKGIQNKQPLVLGKDIDEESAYNNDIYTKGAFFMHTLNYVMGDSLFFPTLKSFATSPEHTYNNLNNTDGVEEFFSKAYGKSLKPLFDMYLRTTNKLEISVTTGRRDNQYLIKLSNINMDLPLDVTTDGGVHHITASSKGIIITSKTMPVIDADGWYFKKVTYE
ncbi:M1 family peptidase [Mucilaginibacter terrenus]|uniref:Aminopeptidase N n=1 Tax=Mucilaginibacter terrenus TaxID=2482727 RepID=A0A3E2NVL4_9SPHI|nr:M1 family metallopeptidase [Mucilaginibacter terrenus]RFZ84900.1 M1 family peptidase [Mucilaginibacter terrenus]